MLCNPTMDVASTSRMADSSRPPRLRLNILIWRHIPRNNRSIKIFKVFRCGARSADRDSFDGCFRSLLRVLVRQSWSLSPALLFRHDISHLHTTSSIVHCYFRCVYVSCTADVPLAFKSLVCVFLSFQMPSNIERPYLGLAARLSQIWLNRFTLLLSVIFVHLLLTAAFLQKDIQSAQREAVAACLALEQTGSVFASLPHFMALGMNEMTRKGIEASVSALATTYAIFVFQS